MLMARKTWELGLPSGSLFHSWTPEWAIILGGPMIGVHPHVAEFVESPIEKKEERSHRANDHER